MRMFTQFFTLTFLIVFSLGCAPVESISVSDEVVLVFVDKTTSSKSDSFIQAKNEQWITKMFEKHQKHGAIFITSYIYSNTAQYGNKEVMRYEIPEQDIQTHDPTQRKMAQMKLEELKESYDAHFIESLTEKFNAGMKQSSGSNIIGSLKQIQEITEEYRGKDVFIYYYSDMLECSDFRAMWCNGVEEAKSYNEILDWAEKDIIRAKRKYNITDKSMDQVSEITVVLPATHLDSQTSHELAPIYWEKVFSAFGCDNVSFY